MSACDPAPSAEEVRALLDEAGTPQPSLVTLPSDLGSPQRTHVFVLDDVVVKVDCSRVDRANRERANLELLASTDLPVPRAIASGELADGRPWLVITRLEGAPPADAARPVHEVSAALAAQLGALAARMHGAPSPGTFGSPTGARADVVEAGERRTRYLLTMGYGSRSVPDDEIVRLVSWLDSTRAVLRTAPAVPSFVHRDTQPRNVLVDGGGTVVGLIDFESGGGGDACEDLALVGIDWRSPGFRAFCEGYASAGGTFDADAPARVAHHVGMWALSIYVYLGAIAPPYVRAARTAVERCTAGEVPDLRPIPTLPVDQHGA